MWTLRRALKNDQNPHIKIMQRLFSFLFPQLIIIDLRQHMLTAWCTYLSPGFVMPRCTARYERHNTDPKGDWYANHPVPSGRC